MSKKLTLGSLFDGSAGFPLGGLISGITPLWASEIEPFPVRVTTKRLPEMEHLGDITSLNGGDLTPVDIITFGSPCQDMSVAGKREGLDGVIHFIPGLFNDNFNFKAIEENTAEMIKTQSEEHNDWCEYDTSDLYSEDVQLIVKGEKLYYLPSDKKTINE